MHTVNKLGPEGGKALVPALKAIKEMNSLDLSGTLSLDRCLVAFASTPLLLWVGGDKGVHMLRIRSERGKLCMSRGYRVSKLSCTYSKRTV